MSRIDHYTINGKDIYKVVPDIAPLFNEDTAYSIGDYVVKDAVLYTFIANHAAGSWNSSEVKAASVSASITELENAMAATRGVIAVDGWIQGGIRTSTGGRSDATNRIVTDYLLRDSIYSINANPNVYKYIISMYSSKEDYTSHYGEYGTGWQYGETCINGISKGTYIRVTLAYIDDSDISVGAGSNVNFVLNTDTTLSLNGVPADAKTVGDINYMSLRYVRKLTSTDDLNTIVEPGIYRYDSGVNAPINAPTVWSSYVQVMGTVNTNGPLCQLLLNSANTVYFRLRVTNSDTFTGWTKLTEYKEELMPNASLYDFGAWTYGDIRTSNGTTSLTRKETRKSCMSRLEPITDLFFKNDNPDISIRLYYYSGNSTSTYLGYLSYDGATDVINIHDGLSTYSNAKYFRMTLRYIDERDFSDYKELCRSVPARIAIHDLYLHDDPRSKGVENVCKRASNLTDITYILYNDLPIQSNESSYSIDGYLPSGTKCVGMKYTSTREEQLFVPQAVSFETFASAILNPNSYIYSRVETSSSNGRTYYGAVCSTFVAYCLGIDDSIPTTIAFSNYLKKLPDYMQNPYSVQIGFAFNHPGSHVAIVTDVIKNSLGKILYIGVSEAAHPYMDFRYWTPEEIQTRYFDVGYDLCFYPYIDGVEDDNISDYMYIDDSMYTNGTINSVLCPRRGDKANWRSGETIEIDILNRGNYTKYVLKNRETDSILSTVTINSDLISLNNLNPGKYSLYLINGSLESEPVYFNVMSTSETYSVNGNNVTVTYSSNLGTATSIMFVNNNSSCSDYRAQRAFHVLTASEISAGQTTISKPSIDELEFEDESYEAPNGVWKMRVMYKTEYGLYSSDLTDVQFQLT